MRTLVFAALLPLVACPAKTDKPIAPAKAPVPEPLNKAQSVSALRAGGNVILVTIDGVRWLEAFDKKYMPNLLRLVEQGAMWGNRKKHSDALIISKRPLSLPGYQSLMMGKRTPCNDNDCARIETETFPEAIARRLKLPKEKVAVFASWDRLKNAASAGEGILVDVGVEPDMPWENARWDTTTLKKSLEHLRTHQPRFLYISLLDADERAHAKDWDGYIAAIRASDDALKQLEDTLKKMPTAYRDNTTVIVTTDHGRGRGPLYHTHSRQPHARHVWLAGYGPFARPRGLVVSRVTHGSVKPTVERLMGLCPTPCEGEGCAEALDDIAGGAMAAGDPCAK